jgi:hypothetical protein
VGTDGHAIDNSSTGLLFICTSELQNSRLKINRVLTLEVRLNSSSCTQLIAKSDLEPRPLAVQRPSLL